MILSSVPAAEWEGCFGRSATVWQCGRRVPEELISCFSVGNKPRSERMFRCVSSSWCKQDVLSHGSGAQLAIFHCWQEQYTAAESTERWLIQLHTHTDYRKIDPAGGAHSAPPDHLAGGEEACCPSLIIPPRSRSFWPATSSPPNFSDTFQFNFFSKYFTAVLANANVKVAIQYSRVDARKYFWSNRVVHIWNLLPAKLSDLWQFSHL